MHRLIYRNSWNLKVGLALVAVGAALIIPEIVVAMRRGWVNGLFSGFILLVVVILGTRASIAGLEIVTGGVRIMNPLRTRYFRWEEIRMFRFYEPQVGPAYVRIELSNGAHYHVFGLMGGFQPEWGEEVRQAAEALNEELANHTP